MSKLSELHDDAIEEFKEELFSFTHQERLDYVQSDEPHDRFHEIADGQVPVYTAESLEMAAENNELAMENDSGLCPDGSPIQIINVNIYESIQEALWEYWNAEKEEIEENAQAVVDALEAFEEALHDDEDERLAAQIIVDIVEEYEVEAGDQDLKLILEERQVELKKAIQEVKEQANG